MNRGFIRHISRVLHKFLSPVKYKFNLKKHLPKLYLYLQHKEKVIFCIESHMSSIVYNNFLAGPIRATVISWSFKMLAQIRLLLAPGNRASAYVAPCIRLPSVQYQDSKRF